jgi:uncharacterized protein YbjT (DUF2867 family)
MIVVTGASGYVAGYTLKQLARQSASEAAGANVVALVRSESQFDKVRRLGATPMLGDVTDLESLQRAFKGAQAVIHLAAVNRDKGRVTMEAVNAQGTLNVVAAAKQAGVQHIVTVVGLGADAQKPYPLARTQGIGVDAIARSGIPYTILESSVIFGAGDEFLNTLAGLAQVPPFMVVPGDGKSKFQPIAVEDVAACAVRALGAALDCPEAQNRRLQIGGPEVVTLEGIVDAILAELKLKRVKVHMPVGLLKPAVAIMDKTLPKPPVTPSLLAQLGVDNVATDNATERVFGVKPMRMQDGIGYVRDMSLGRLISRSLGRADFR